MKILKEYSLCRQDNDNLENFIVEAVKAFYQKYNKLPEKIGINPSVKISIKEIKVKEQIIPIYHNKTCIPKHIQLYHQIST
jgi:hypothetical protein